MYTWTAPLPATPTLTATIPAIPTLTAPVPAVPTAVIEASTIPYIEPQALAAFTGVGQIALPYMPSQIDPMPGTAIGTLQTVTRAAVPESASPAGTGSLAAIVKVSSGTVVINAGFTGVGAFDRDDAPFTGAGTLSATITPAAILLAPFYGVGVDSGGTAWPAAFTGAGTLSGSTTPNDNAAPAAGGVGSLAATVAVSGGAVLTATFGGLGALTGTETGMTGSDMAPFAGTGALAALTGGVGDFSGIGALAAQLGGFALFAGSGTGVMNVSFPALFGSVGQLAMAIAPQAEFNGQGTFVPIVSAIVSETAGFSGAGALGASTAAAITAGFSGTGTLFGSAYAELNASGSGTGDATVSVLWSEAEAGGFGGTGTLVMEIVTPVAAEYALVFESTWYRNFSTVNEAYGLLFAPNPLDENNV